MTASSQQKPSAPKWLRAVLGASLALNVLFVGLAVGAIARFGDMQGHRAPPHSIGAAMFRELSHEDRRALRDRASEVSDRSAQSRDDGARAIAEALRADPFDPNAVLDILEAQASSRNNWQQSVQTAWLDRVSQMNTVERADYADRLQETLTQHRKPRRRNGD